MEFREFGKIARLYRPVVVTEKIDGTNASVEIIPAVDVPMRGIDPSYVLATSEAGDIMLAGSRTRYVVPANDNYGWAAWVKANAAELWSLGPGQHFGEWWGQGIQRKYGLTEKRFSLFNVGRWYDAHGTNAPDDIEKQRSAPACCRVVPILARLAKLDTTALDAYLESLRIEGSVAAPGFKPAEGIVVYHAASKQLFKVTCERDEEPKGKTA
jgi:hypothetical protein